MDESRRSFLKAAGGAVIGLSGGFPLLCAGCSSGRDGHGPSGDAAAGEAAFNQCQTCHVVKNADGETLAGRNGRTGPNLYGVAGRMAGSVGGFRYGKEIVEAGEAGLMWDEESFVGFVQDPSTWLGDHLGKRARSKMSYRVRSEEDAANLWAYLYSLAPPNEDGSSVYSE